MRLVNIPLGLVTIALLLSAPALGYEVGGYEHDVTVDGQEATVGLPDTGGSTPADAEARGTAKTAGVNVHAKGPTCRVDSLQYTDAKQARCEKGHVTYDTTTPTLNYGVSVRLGDLQQADRHDPGDDVTTSDATIAEMPATSYTVVIAAAAAAGATGLAAYGITRLLRGLGFLGLAPLYSHIRDEDLLKDENRSRIHKLIDNEPGISTKDIAERLDLAWGTVTHHLGKLEKRRLIVSKKYGKYRRYFVNGAASKETKDMIAILQVPRTQEVATYVRNHPGVTQKEVSDALGVSSSTILWHVKRLERVDLIRKVRQGKTVHYYAGELLNQMDVIHSAGTSATTA